MGRLRRDAARPTWPMSPPLADAFLALADDDAFVDQRTVPRVLAATAAAVVLVIGGPLAFLTLHPSDHPVAALSSKFSLGSDDE
jgi:hypothetical protein